MKVPFLIFGERLLYYYYTQKKYTFLCKMKNKAPSFSSTYTNTCVDWLMLVTVSKQKQTICGRSDSCFLRKKKHIKGLYDHDLAGPFTRKANTATSVQARCFIMLCLHFFKCWLKPPRQSRGGTGKWPHLCKSINWWCKMCYLGGTCSSCKQIVQV